MKLSKILFGMFGAKPPKIAITADERHVMLETPGLSMAVYDSTPLSARYGNGDGVIPSWNPHAWSPFPKNAIIHKMRLGSITFGWRRPFEVVHPTRDAPPVDMPPETDADGVRYGVTKGLAWAFKDGWCADVVRHDNEMCELVVEHADERNVVSGRWTPHSLAETTAALRSHMEAAGAPVAPINRTWRNLHEMLREKNPRAGTPMN